MNQGSCVTIYKRCTCYIDGMKKTVWIENKHLRKKTQPGINFINIFLLLVRKYLEIRIVCSL